MGLHLLAQIDIILPVKSRPAVKYQKLSCLVVVLTVLRHSSNHPDQRSETSLGVGVRTNSSQRRIASKGSEADCVARFRLQENDEEEVELWSA